jgi:serine/threonine protein kinase
VLKNLVHPRLVRYEGAALLDPLDARLGPSGGGGGVTNLTLLMQHAEPDGGMNQNTENEQDGARLLIMMELCANGALREGRQACLPWGLKIRIAADVAEGLEFLHRHMVIHRDLKSTNVLLDDDWRAKICDHSYAIGDRSPEIRTFTCGTYEFMSPEMACGEPYTGKTDIFSFGVVLCELICEKEPGLGGFLVRDSKTFFVINEAEIRRAAQPGCPPSFLNLTLQCVQSDAELRPSASEALDWLQSLLGELVTTTGASFEPEDPGGLLNPSNLGDREGTVQPGILSPTGRRLFMGLCPSPGDDDLLEPSGLAPPEEKSSRGRSQDAHQGLYWLKRRCDVMRREVSELTAWRERTERKDEGLEECLRHIRSDGKSVASHVDRLSGSVLSALQLQEQLLREIHSAVLKRPDGGLRCQSFPAIRPRRAVEAVADLLPSDAIFPEAHCVEAARACEKRLEAVFLKLREGLKDVQASGRELMKSPVNSQSASQQFRAIDARIDAVQTLLCTDLQATIREAEACLGDVRETLSASLTRRPSHGRRRSYPLTPPTADEKTGSADAV